MSKMTKKKQNTNNLVFLKELPHSYDGPEETRREAMALICQGEVAKGKAALEHLYQQGDLWAGHTLAYGYQEEWFDEVNHELAVTIYRDIIARGSKWTMSNLAYCYQTGSGVRKNMHWAIYWYKKAIELGDDKALINLAYLYVFGPKKYRDIEAGIALCKRAPKDCAEAYILLGKCNERGLGMPVNPRKAKRLYQKAAEL